MAAPDFIIQLSNFPVLLKLYTAKELQVLIYNHLQNVALKEKQCISSLKSENASKIINVELGTSDQGQIRFLLKIAACSKQLDILNMLQQKVETNNYQSQIEFITGLMGREVKMLEAYRASIKGRAFSTAYITFRSMEGAHRILQAYRQNVISRCFQTYICKHKRTYVQNKM